MNQGMNWIRLMAIGMVVLVGCDKAPSGKKRNAITFQRISQERSKDFNFVFGKKTVTFKANLEYPAQTGLDDDDYQGLTVFINEMLGSKTDIAETVDNMAESLFICVQPFTTNTALQADINLDLSVTSEIKYSDERYLSCEVLFVGPSYHPHFKRAVYDRQLGKSLKLCDLVATNDYPKLRKLLRENLAVLFTEEISKDMLKDKRDDWPVIHECFYFTSVGVEWLYNREQSGTGAWTPYIVEWEDLKPILKDPTMIPSGLHKYTDDAVVVRQEDGDDWWNVPFSKMNLSENTPPNPPWDDKKYPLSLFHVRLEKPGQGTMSDVKYKALLDFVGGLVAHDKNPHPTIDAAVNLERIAFWQGVIKEAENSDMNNAFEAIQNYLRMEGEIKYCDEQYFCYAVWHLHGDPFCCRETAGVWNWKKMQTMKITDFIDTNKHKVALKKLMRKAVYEEFKGSSADERGAVLPDYAKDWPHTFENFYVNKQGIGWCFDAVKY